jgi:hypothetical protein
VRINLRGEDAEEPRLREAAMLAKRAAGFGVQAMESTQETKKGKDDA